MAVQISAYFSSISWDARKRYLQKLRIGGIGLPDPFGIDEGLWSEDVKKWPTMEFGDLYSYLVNTEGTYRQESLKVVVPITWFFWKKSWQDPPYCLRYATLISFG